MSAGNFKARRTVNMSEETPKTHKRVRLTRSIILNKEHADAGSEHEVPNALAQRLVGKGSAEHVDPQDAATSVNRMAAPDNADPVTKQVAPAAAKVHKGAHGK
jgi:hypothetical protein